VLTPVLFNFLKNAFHAFFKKLNRTGRALVIEKQEAHHDEHRTHSYRTARMELVASIRVEVILVEPILEQPGRMAQRWSFQ
jgi:hypothetical protein